MSGNRKLIFRLSSLGDIVLASAALEALPYSDRADWVISKEFAPLLRGHPRIRKLWEFDRFQGLLAWVRFCKQLRNEGYTEIFDLHRSLRTRLAKGLFFFWRSSASWRSFPKQRGRFNGYCWFKGLWPTALRPTPLVERFAKTLGGSGKERPDLGFLAKNAAAKIRIPEDRYFCVMPSSKWIGKCWPVENFARLIRLQTSLGMPVILGSARDRASHELVEILKRENIRHFSGVGKWNLPEVASVLSGAKAYLGNDTGLGHLAESLDVPAVVVFGPTVSDLGFGPWKKESISVGSDIWCRPCGKDGRKCFRLKNRFQCLKGLEPKQVAHEIQSGAFP